MRESHHALSVLLDYTEDDDIDPIRLDATLRAVVGTLAPDNPINRRFPC
jgi:hypothetical protein